MESLEIHTCLPTVNWEDGIFFIYPVGSKTVTPIVKHIYIPDCSLQ